MKKLTIIALALCLAVVMAAPVMAVDADFSGTYRVRGISSENVDLDKDSASNAFMDMRLRLQTVFKVSDNLSLTTRFDALDRMWGTTDNANTTENIDFDRAYMTIKSDIGTFSLGRMAGGGFGTTFVDSVSDYDRIKYIKTIDNMTVGAIFQKNEENDAITTPTANADLDSDTYYLLGKYKMENATTGILLSLKNDKTTDTATSRTYGAVPYFVGKYGPLAIQAELAYNWGEIDNDTTADIDIKKLAYNVEASYNFGPASLMAGYAFLSGDNSDATENSAYGSCGNDWEKLFILTTDEYSTLKTGLGGSGNLAQGSDAGAKVIYGAVNATPIENLALGLVVGTADADKVAAGAKDDYGTEYDITLNWKIYDNLSYSAIAAFLDSGDIYTTTNPEDIYALFHQLQLKF